MTQGQFSANGSSQMNETGAEVVLIKQVRAIPRDFLCELQSAASSIMSREECAELDKEFREVFHPHSAAA